MDSNFHEVYNDVEKAIDYAFNGQFVLKFYDYLKVRGTKKVEVDEFINSTTANEINSLVIDLDDYIEGGTDEMQKKNSECYGKFGNGSTFPQVTVDEKNIGGCTNTVQYLKEQNLV